MRLIDADALKEKAWDADTRCGFVQVVDIWDIDAAPTIEPKKVVEDYCRPRNLMVVAAEDFHRLVEQKRGKWIYKTQNVKGGKGQTYGKWQCSCCKKKEPRRRDYCPNCGAKMDEVSNE